MVSTDASFAPGGGLIHGSVVAMIGGSGGAPRSSHFHSSNSRKRAREVIEGVIVGDSLEELE